MQKKPPKPLVFKKRKTVARNNVPILENFPIVNFILKNNKTLYRQVLVSAASYRLCHSKGLSHTDTTPHLCLSPLSLPAFIEAPPPPHQHCHLPVPRPSALKAFPSPREGTGSVLGSVLTGTCSSSLMPSRGALFARLWSRRHKRRLQAAGWVPRPRDPENQFPWLPA